MRTTVSIDDDILLAVRERARRERRSIGEVLSELARQALAGRTPWAGGESLCGFDPLPPRGLLVSNAFLDQLREDEGE